MPRLPRGGGTQAKCFKYHFLVWEDSSVSKVLALEAAGHEFAPKHPCKKNGCISMASCP